jgi:hypothetical protein
MHCLPLDTHATLLPDCTAHEGTETILPAGTLYTYEGSDEPHPVFAGEQAHYIHVQGRCYRLRVDPRKDE